MTTGRINQVLTCPRNRTTTRRESTCTLVHVGTRGASFDPQGPNRDEPGRSVRMPENAPLFRRFHPRFLWVVPAIESWLRFPFVDFETGRPFGSRGRNRMQPDACTRNGQTQAKRGRESGRRSLSLFSVVFLTRKRCIILVAKGPDDDAG